MSEAAIRDAWAKLNAALDEHGDSPEYRTAWAEWVGLVLPDPEEDNRE